MLRKHSILGTRVGNTTAFNFAEKKKLKNVLFQFKRMLNKELSHFSESSRSGNQISEYICSTFLDKQQELDIPTVIRIDEAAEPPKGAQRKERPRAPTTMSQISGVNRKLCHTNSFTGERLPTYGVETPFEEDLGM